MLDDFFSRALLGGIALAIAAGPLGCFVVWRKMSYFGAALAHASLLGVTLGLLLGLDPGYTTMFVCLGCAWVFTLLQRPRLLHADALLAVIAHVALALGLVLLAFLDSLRVDLMGYLFGDIIAISKNDLFAICALAVGVLVMSWHFWNDLLAITFDEDLAAVEGVAVARVHMTFVALLAIVIALGIKLVGMLLIVSMLVIPAAAARWLARTPEQMVALATLIGVLSTIGGLHASLNWDIPAGAAIVLISAAGFSLCLAGHLVIKRGDG